MPEAGRNNDGGGFGRGCLAASRNCFYTTVSERNVCTSNISFVFHFKWNFKALLFGAWKLENT
jgi:hypothetical protein